MTARKPLHPECTGSVTCTVQNHVYVRRNGARGSTISHIKLTRGQRKTLKEGRR